MAYIVSNEDLKRQLYNLNRNYYGEQTWRDLYLQTSLGREQALSDIKYDYGQAMNEAYASAMAQQSAIENSALGQGYKEALLTDTDAALREAFDTYRANYQSAVSTIEENTATANQAITDELTKQAEYTAKMTDAPYQYLQYVFDKYKNGEIVAVDDEGNPYNIFEGEENWAKYTYKDPDTGELMLKSKDELMGRGKHKIHTDAEGNEYVEWTGFYDQAGNLTVAGMDFYDQMLNELGAMREGPSFGNWLYETDKDLYNWSTSYNPYNYTEAGTNLGSFKTLFGMTSTDQQYQFLERFGGWTESQIETKFSDFNARINEIANRDIREGKTNVEDMKAITDELKKMAEEFGIENDFDFDALNREMTSAVNSAKNRDDINADTWATFFNDLGTFAAIGTGAGLGVAGITPYALIGTALGAVIGTIVGTIDAGIDRHKYKEENERLMQESKNAFLDISGKMLQYSLEKRRQQALKIK